MPTLRELFRNKADGSDILTPSSGGLVVGCTFVQEVASDTWVVTHRKDSLFLGVQVYINSELVEADDIKIIDTNSFEIIFSEAVTGNANFLTFALEEGCNLDITPTPTISVTPSITVSQSLNATPTPTPTLTPDATPTPSAEVDSIASGIIGFTSSADSVQTFPFSAPFTNATSIGGLDLGGISSVSGVSDRTSGTGYLVGGFEPILGTHIRTFPFAAPVAGATFVGILTGVMHGHTTNQSSIDGYSVAGANLGVTSSNIDRFPFSSPHSGSSAGSILESSKSSASQQNSTTDGFVTGGYALFGSASINCDSFPFSTPFASVVNVGSLLSDNYVDAIGVSSTTNGYVIAGNNHTPTAIAQTSITSFPFAASFLDTTTIGNLINERGSTVQDCQSESVAAIMGTAPPSIANVIETFPFVSPFTNSTDVGDLLNAAGDTGHSF